MTVTRFALISTAALLTAGCVAKTIVGVATLPVRATSQTADWATVSQDEADRDRGRRDRKAEREARKRDREACRDAGYRDCP
ncbi:MAG: hypothetical protein ABI395_03190 [Sphingobium sp.]